MATRPATFQPAASRIKHSTRAFAPRRKAGTVSRSSLLPVFASRPSADLAGRAVTIGHDVPVEFDAPLAPHHQLLGRWIAGREDSARRFKRSEARRHIESVFNAAVIEILKPIEIAELRVVVLHGEGDKPPAFAVICDSVGQLDLGWIEKTSVLQHTAFGEVAPVGWRAAAYRALEQTLSIALPIFNYGDLFDEISMYYWDGATEDDDALTNLIEYRGADPDDPDLREMLPSAMNARRPDYMVAKSAPLKDMPASLRARLKRLRDAHKALQGFGYESNSWYFDFALACEYLPDIEDCSTLPPMTLVPADQFARELDDVGQHGMQQGFMDIAGFYAVPEADRIDVWLASLKLGAEVLLAAQDLIGFDPAKPEAR